MGASMRLPRLRTRRPSGFTLVELLIVVVILAILAAIVIPQFSNSSAEAKQARFADSLRVLSDAFDLYKAKTGNDIVDASSGVWDAEMDGYITQISYEKKTPVGGVWDTELGSFGVTSAVGVHFLVDTPQEDAFMLKIDDLMDDGDLATGGFRKLASDRFYMVLVE